jgi:hypothetical protein
MSEHIFFNENRQIDDVAKSIFSAIGVQNNIQEGDSSNVLNGVYYCYSVFGVQVKLENNSYDYDDKYNYMLTVRKDVLSDLVIDDNIIKNVANIILELLSQNLHLEIAYEVDSNNLKVFNGGSASK